jgi:hypothetical protein
VHPDESIAPSLKKPRTYALELRASSNGQAEDYQRQLVCTNFKASLLGAEPVESALFSSVNAPKTSPAGPSM